jgi:YHYH protein
VTVDGEVTWPSELEITREGDTRVVRGNDLPGHPTGEYPVSSSDDAYQYDPNPNSISEQDLALELPATPALADEPQCTGGEVGVLLTGSLVFNAVDAGGRDAVAHEVQDSCDGHPQNTGVYHYHSVSGCAEDDHGGRHSELVGYAFDGFGIYGHYGEDGEVLTNEDLDECHGHTHEIEWDGEPAEMYHYHATYEFPYTVGCFRGTTVTRFGGGGGGQPPTFGVTEGHPRSLSAAKARN